MIKINSLSRIIICLILSIGSISCMTNVNNFQTISQQIGKGAYRVQANKTDSKVPHAPYRNDAIKSVAVPTNQWYSSVMYSRWSAPIYAIPLTLKPTQEGFEIGLPTKKVVPTYRKDVDIFYSHIKDFIIKPLSFEPESTQLADFSDWSADIDLKDEKNYLRATVTHGSPFIYFNTTEKIINLQLSENFSVSVRNNGKTLLLKNTKKSYLAFAPGKATWEKKTPKNWQLTLPEGQKYFSIAAIPNDDENTLNKFTKSAYSFITGTKVDWQVNRRNKEIQTTYLVNNEIKEGQETAPIIGLYPHHYHKNSNITSPLIGKINSIRGDINFYHTTKFQTTQKHRGFTPYWPAIKNEKLKTQLQTQLNRDNRRARSMMLEIGHGPYWQGKGLQRISQLMNVAYMMDEEKIQQKLLNLIKNRMEKWLSGKDGKSYFHYDKKSGTVVSYPEEYDAVKDMNDHHFHYGYWIRAAAEVGMLDKEWIKEENWGGMINLLVEDIATTQRKSKKFPFIRNFDPYEGHSWASGIARGEDGNNQESTSEAINAWAALILWGEVTNRPDLVDLGMYLYNTEIQAAQYYWFDVHDITLPDEYLNADVCILFGGKLVHYTWWIDEPRQTHGINFLPITPSSTYLGEYPNYVKKNLDALAKETELYEARYKKAKPVDIWQDIFAKYLALADPEAGMQAWDPWGSFELGDTRSHAINWLGNLLEMGTPELSITANSTFYAVFKKNNKKTYLAYNPRTSAQEITFSDNTKIKVEAKQLGILRR